MDHITTLFDNSSMWGSALLTLPNLSLANIYYNFFATVFEAEKSCDTTIFWDGSKDWRRDNIKKQERPDLRRK